jgi:hypothetical protein
LYVPFGVLLLVCTVTVVLTLLDPVIVIEVGKKLHVELGGNPAQESATVRVKPFSGATVTL